MCSSVESKVDWEFEVDGRRQVICVVKYVTCANEPKSGESGLKLPVEG